MKYSYLRFNLLPTDKNETKPPKHKKHQTRVLLLLKFVSVAYLIEFRTN